MIIPLSPGLSVSVGTFAESIEMKLFILETQHGCYNYLHQFEGKEANWNLFLNL